jgi:hypothetical protein
MVANMLPACYQGHYWLRVPGSRTKGFWRGGIDQHVDGEPAHAATGDDAADPAVMSGSGRVSRVSPVHTAMRNCARDEGRPFEAGSQVLASSHRKLLSSRAMVVSVAETPERDSGRHG